MADKTLIEKVRECNGRLVRGEDDNWKLLTNALAEVDVEVTGDQVETLVEAGELVLTKAGAIIPQG